MVTFSTAHIFGFGDAQIIGKDAEGKNFNKKTPLSGLTKLQAFVDHVKTFKPADIALTDYHVIHIFNNFDVRYLGTPAKDAPSETKSSWTIKWSDLNPTIVGDLIDEVYSKN